MKKFVILLLVLGIVAAACGDDDAGADPASLSSCESLADAGIGMLQDTINLIDSMDATELAALGEGGEVPPEFAAIQERGDALSARADEIGCSDEEMSGLMAQRAGDLEANSVFSQFILEGIQSGEGDFFDN